MPTITSASSRIADLQAQIKELEQSALEELMEKRNSLSHQLAKVDEEISKLRRDKPAKPKQKYSRGSILGSTPTLFELLDLLAGVKGKTLSLRREGIDVKHVKGLVAQKPHLLKLGGKGAWPEVTLVK